MTRILIAILIVLVAVPQFGGAVALAQAQDEPLGGPGADVDCEDLVSQADAQAVYDEDRADPYGLDGPIGPDNDTTGTPDEACETGLGDIPGASCADFKQQRHAQALLRASGGDDPYGLDANGDGQACSPSRQPAAEVPVDTPLAPALVPESGDCEVIVENGRAFVFTDCPDGTVRAGFEPFEGFDAFAARAQNWFGAFDDGDGGATITVEAQQAALPAGSSGGTASPARAAGESRVVESEQQTARRSAKK